MENKGKEKILVSSYLLGLNCKYDGGNNYSKEIYDGTFTHTVIDGDGVTAELLKNNGIEIITIK